MRSADGWGLVSAADLEAHMLAVGDVVDERALRSRLGRLTNQSLAQPIHALLDQAEPRATFRVEP